MSFGFGFFDFLLGLGRVFFIFVGFWVFWSRLNLSREVFWFKDFKSLRLLEVGSKVFFLCFRVYWIGLVFFGVICCCRGRVFIFRSCVGFFGFVCLGFGRFLGLA